jgi:hypothetical protein
MRCVSGGLATFVYPKAPDTEVIVWFFISWPFWGTIPVEAMMMAYEAHPPPAGWLGCVLIASFREVLTIAISVVIPFSLLPWVHPTQVHMQCASTEGGG